MTILTAEPEDPTGYGRVLRKLRKGKQTDEVERIVEQKALRGREAQQREINSGIYAFANRPLFPASTDSLPTILIASSTSPKSCPSRARPAKRY